MSAIVNEDFIDESSNKYVLQIATIDNVLSELNLSEDDEAITKSIILNLECEASNAIKIGLIASIPSIGCVQKDLLKETLRKRSDELKAARASLSKEDYKNYVREVQAEIKADLKDKYLKRKLVDRIKKQSKKFYDTMVINRGMAYTNLYIASRLWIEHIPFNKEVQEQYDIIANLNKEE